MKKLRLAFAALAALSASVLFAQDISGTWQGTLSAGGRDLRTVVKISKADAGYKSVFYSIDQGGQPIPVASTTLQGTTVKMTIPAIGGTFEGKLSNTDATTITGSWSQGPNPLPLVLNLANDKTAWTIPEPPPPPVLMAKDAIPAFDVATIKPSVPDAPGKGIRMNGRNFSTLNTSLNDLITFAYGLHARQITGGPNWMDTDKYDLAGVPDKPGIPNSDQLKAMIKKLLAERFQLKFHNEKKELTVFTINVAKTGLKIEKSSADPNGLPGLGFRGLGNLVVRNANMADFANLMQSAVLDRPVVDQTGLPDKFDFTLLWTPDETQFVGMGAKVPPPPENPTNPDLFTAMQQQLGLKMESAKAPVDVLAIDHVEKPSAN